MSPSSKSDVKNHLSARARVGSFPFLPVSQQDLAGFSGTDTDKVKVDTSGFIEDFVVEHTPFGKRVVQTIPRSPRN